MPGSCESEKNSSSLISSLRKYRFQNKSKQPQGVETSAQSSSKSNSGSGSTKSVNTPASQKSSSSSYNPLGYRKYENTNTAESLRNIWGKIRASFKNNSTISIIDLTLTVEETKLLKDTVLQQPAISVKWSTSISEHAAKDSNGKLLKIKRMYIHELLKCVADELKSKFSIDINGQLTSEKPPVRTYSRNKPSENTVNQSSLSSLNNNLGDHSQGAMDDYEEFCEKEQCLRKMLQTFPGADIMEAQDILVRCQWDLNKAIIEARNQPLRTARKRGSPGNSVPLTSAPNIANQGTMANSQQTEKDISEEIITLDSSDEDDVNSTMSQLSRLSKSTNNVSSPILPPAKRARRLISTSTSSEDEMTTPAKSPVNVPPPKSHVLPVQQKPTTFLQQQTPTTSMQQTSVQPKPSTTVQAPVQKKPALQAPIQQKLQPSVQTPSSAQSSSSSDKTINAPQSLSIKPVSASSSASSEKASVSSAASSEKASPSLAASSVKVSASSAAPSVKASASSAAPSVKASASSMPNLPKGLVLFQVSDLDDLPKKLEETPMNGNASNIPPNTSKSAQLIRIKTSNKVTVSSSPSSPAVASSSSASIASVSSSKTVNIPMGKGVSLTPVNQTANVTKNNPKIKTLSITPVNSASSKDSSLKAKSPSNSSEEEESSSTEKSISNEQKKKSKMENVVNEANGKEMLPEADESFELVKKKKGRHRKHEKNSGKRKRFSSDDDDEEEYGNEDIYDSEDSDWEENLTSAHSAVLKFFQEASPEELGSIPGCSKKKIEAITNLRPFSKWIDLVEKLRNDKGLSTDLLNGAKKVLDMRNAITKLMTKCQRISLDMEDLVENLKENKETSSDYVSKQPELLNERMHLTAYQMLGLNWLLLMHNQEVNAILADEMGLGKTVQAISFLAYLKQIEEEGPHLIVVPSSTLDNWRKELETWWPSVSVICYHGSQESRRELRMQILNDEVEEFDIMITTYNMVTSSAEDRMFFKRLEFNYVVFDEAHMLKNMASQRYTNLMRIKAPRRLLLTGTPLQNNLVELMSLLIFAMPHMFSGKIDQIKQMFSCVSKTATGNRNTYEKDRVEHAKRIMKPFVLRRLKRDVLKELPKKQDETRYCPMVEDQAKKYEELITKFTAQVQVESNEEREKDPSTSGAGMMMQLRRAANHPLLLRRFYDDEKLLSMSKLMLKEPTHSMSDPNIIFEDMAVMSDFELHKLCRQYKSLNTYALPDSAILNSGKLKVLDELLPDLIKEDHRILLFSQFTMVLDIIQEYMNIKNYKFLRLDGQVPVPERQQLIDEFNNDPEILFFLLSTKAGGLGINLTAADTVVLHDIDFNPYNDKQAEDRCHRVGQVRDVRVIRMISEKTIEEGILQRATEKLKLEKDIHDEGVFQTVFGKTNKKKSLQDNEENDTASVAMLLRDALGLKPKS